MINKSKLKKLSKIAVILVAISGVCYAGYSYKFKSTEVTAEAQSFKEEKVTKGDILLGFDSDGESELSVTNLDFSIVGELSELYAELGQEVKKGDVVAKLDDTEYVDNLERAKVDYEEAVVKLNQAKKNHELSVLSEKQKLDDYKLKVDKTTLDNESQLLEEKQKVDDAKAKFKTSELEYLPMLEITEYYSKQELEEKRISYENNKTAYETALQKYNILEKQLNSNLESDKAAYEAQLERYNIISNDNSDIQSAEINIKDAEIALKIAKENINNTILTSPVDGKVLHVSYKVGENVSLAGNSDEITSNTDHFILLTDSDKVQVLSPVSEEDLNNVSIGQQVEVEFEAFDNKIFNGEVISIATLPEIENNGIVTYDIAIELSDGTEDIKTGMTCSVEFILKQKKDVIIIPNKAVTIVDGKQTVEVKDEQGNIVSKTVVTGLTDGKNCEVIEGLTVGEIVIIKENN